MIKIIYTYYINHIVTDVTQLYELEEHITMHVALRKHFFQDFQASELLKNLEEVFFHY